MYIDSHTHLYLDEFAGEGTGVVKRAIETGVDRMMFPNVNLSTIAPMNALASIFPQNIDMAIGLHPTDVNSQYLENLKIIEQEAYSNKYCAIGEIGIDMYWDKTYADEQQDAFIRQCNLAVRLKLPIIIHCRDGLDTIIDAFSHLEEIPQGVFHSFSGTNTDVDRIREIGDFYFGINGIVTFKNSAVKNVLSHIGLSRLLIETDSPYLAPVPKRGKRNESSYIVYTTSFIANELGISAEELGEITSNNYNNLFRRQLTKH